MRTRPCVCTEVTQTNKQPIINPLMAFTHVIGFLFLVHISHSTFRFYCPANYPWLANSSSLWALFSVSPCHTPLCVLDRLPSRWKWSVSFRSVCHATTYPLMMMMMMMNPIDALRPLLCTWQAKWTKWPPKVITRSQRWNILQICPRRDS